MDLKMIYFSICDDDALFAKRIELSIRSKMKHSKLSFSILTFTSGKNLLYEITEGQKPDVLFLDISLPDINGMNVAKEIKKHSPQTLILFVSEYEQYVYDVFLLQPFRFIPKNQINDRFNEALLSALNVIQEREKKQFIIKTSMGIEKIAIDDIVMISREGNYVLIFMSDNQNYKMRTTLKSIYNSLPQEYFVWVTQRICNIKHIQKIKNNMVLMDTELSLNIPHGAIEDLKSKILNYWTASKTTFQL